MFDFINDAVKATTTITKGAVDLTATIVKAPLDVVETVTEELTGEKKDK